MAKTTELAPVSAALAVISPKLLDLASVPIVDPKTITRTAPPPDLEAATIALLEADGYEDIDAAFNDLYRVYGVARFADKGRLADEGTEFIMQEIVIRKGGDYNATDDDWAIKIVTEDGEPQILTLSMYNAKTGEPITSRNQQLVSQAAAMRKFKTSSPPMLLIVTELTGDRKGQRFFTLEPAALHTRREGVSAQAIDVPFERQQ